MVAIARPALVSGGFMLLSPWIVSISAIVAPLFMYLPIAPALEWPVQGLPDMNWIGCLVHLIV